MRALWSEETTRKLWRRVWAALAAAQATAGLLTSEEVGQIRAHQDEIDIPAAHALEVELGHDLASELRVFAGQCGPAGGRLHLGATSADIEDNADALRLRQALDMVAGQAESLLQTYAALIGRHAGTPLQGYTHLQAAEPTTLGYRLCQYAQDLWSDLDLLAWTRGQVRGKGLKGAVGTQGAYAVLLAGTGVTPSQLEQQVMAHLGLDAAPVSTQTYPRKTDFLVLNALAALAQTLHRFALDVRLLQSAGFGELAEPFGSRQIGSSAMPFKRNPVQAERICSLARYVAALPAVAWANAAQAMLERTLDDSANRRLILPDAFLAVDEMLRLARRVASGLQVSRPALERNLARYTPFTNSTVLLARLAAAGGDRQALHERIREHAMAAWVATERGEANPLAGLLAADPVVAALLPAGEIGRILAAPPDVGEAPALCQAFLGKLAARQQGRTAGATAPSLP